MSPADRRLLVCARARRRGGLRRDQRERQRIIPRGHGATSLPVSRYPRWRNVRMTRRLIVCTTLKPILQ